jgi:hypothetical protein
MRPRLIIRSIIGQLGLLVGSDFTLGAYHKALAQSAQVGRLLQNSSSGSVRLHLIQVFVRGLDLICLPMLVGQSLLRRLSSLAIRWSVGTQKPC